MKELIQLSALMTALEDQLLSCMRCGFCQAQCPLYAVTGRETDVARGKLAMLRGLAERILDDPEGVKENLERCLLCGSCAAGCPSGVKVLDIFVQARSILAGYLGISPFKRFVFRRLLANPSLFNRVSALAPKVQDLLARPVNPVLDTFCARIASPLGKRHLKRLAPTPLHKQGLPQSIAPGDSGLCVAFFPGCLVDKLYPEVGRAALKVMAHHGVGVETPDLQACCGLPALAAGERRAFRDMLLHNLVRFNPDRFDYLLTVCASCSATMRQLWPLMSSDLNPRDRRRVAALAAKTRDISEFLVETGLVSQPAVGNTAAGEQGTGTVTYHDPCHLAKSQGVRAPPRAVIAASNGCRLKEMSQPDWCCGLGGSFSLEHYDLSREIAKRKLQNIIDTGCQTVATGCPACMVQLADVLSQAGSPVRVRHTIELYAESL